MALSDIWAMCGGRENVGLESIVHIVTGRNHCKSKTSGMEFESDWTRHGKSSAFTAQVIRSATSFMPWSCRIPIGEGYHEFL
ncbi:hypothetical protein I3843_06G095400 [Carya illinoinensis]|uniref:Uncharacterized protein n=1 Tax=Carya illinoinensis TaxID=32201 RepID=A0A8T1QA80_CARIL|nr:hypothetical protein I3760_06G102300 [Carya illinoinensis]KAG6651297.1 hypothetical protein CIPAW_06G101300 [Carya illinoinensis]KAG6708844.1 hypothetical protein I3842_06G101800 [Carya illinoinensis]KAG7975383.1 hypothetical protein I3843_06G095400 [Carya illinoinensis]